MKNYLRTLTLFCCFLLSSCSLPLGNQAVVHPYAEPEPPSSRAIVRTPRKLVLFLDGTNNNIESRTNVRRYYEIASSFGEPNVLCYYDQGVGTKELGGNRLGNLFAGSSLGFGFENNVWEAMAFLSTHYRAEMKDEVYIFGFSRGAYTAGVLSTVIGTAGIPIVPTKTNESVKERYDRARGICRTRYKGMKREMRKIAREMDRAYPMPENDKIHEVALDWRKGFDAALKDKVLKQRLDKDTLVETEALGLWDPVSTLLSGLKVSHSSAIGHDPKSEFIRQKGERTNPYIFGPYIKNCYVAFALDERRQAFSPDLPCSYSGAPVDYDFVWFVGDHSDVGGGYKNKDLGGVTLNWMMGKTAEKILGKKARSLKVYENALGDRHDLSYDPGKWKYTSYRVRSEVLSPQVYVEVARIKSGRGLHRIRPLRSEGWKMHVHQSVLTRMKSGSDWYEKVYLSPDGSQKDLVGKSYPLSTPYIPRPFNAEERSIGIHKEIFGDYFDSQGSWSRPNQPVIQSAGDLKANYSVVE